MFVSSTPLSARHSLSAKTSTKSAAGTCILTALRASQSVKFIVSSVFTSNPHSSPATGIMKLLTIFVAVFAAFLPSYTCSASWWSSSSVDQAASPPDSCANVSDHAISRHGISNHKKWTEPEAQWPGYVQALLPRADSLLEIAVHRGNVKQLNRFSRISEDLLHRHFNQWNVTALPAIKNTDAAEFLDRIEAVLRQVSTLPRVKVVSVETPASLPNVRAYFAKETLDSKEAGGQLCANIALLLSAAEYYELGRLNEAVGRAYAVVSSSWPELMRLSEQCWAAISKYHVPEVELCRIRALLGKVRDLAEDMRDRAGRYEGLKGFLDLAFKRADDILTIVKKGCVHESEAVLQYLRNSVEMGKEPLDGPASSGDEQADRTTWFSRVTEHVQKIKWNLGW
ncbi:hypothetical protein LTR29_007231 [Friedmanniomyces endolithicus]|nr:hypothetical protein LTR29_007231 [Friedmanniomyces endolithicus]